MKRIKLTSKNQRAVIKLAIEKLEKGELVIYPTETCYGIGADATNQKAIDRLLAYKTQRKDKPISVAVTGKDMAREFVRLNKMAENIYDNFLPGPITVVSMGLHKLAKGVESISGTQGVRVPKHPFVLKLLGEFKRPITATSANASYKKTPYRISDILKNISEKQKKLIGLIIDAGTLPKRKPSTIIDTTLENIHILREGTIHFDNPIIHKATNEADTEKLASIIFEKIKKHLGKKNIIFLLEGDLGAGKTHFTKYFAKLLKIKNNITSPTFVICNEYKGMVQRKKINFYHVDTYRLYDSKEMDLLDTENIFKKPNIAIIEWANKVREDLKRHTANSVVVDMSISIPSESERIFKYKINEK